MDSEYFERRLELAAGKAERKQGSKSKRTPPSSVNKQLKPGKRESTVPSAVKGKVPSAAKCNVEVDLLKGLRRSPTYFLNDWAKRNDFKVQFERLSSPNQETWTFRVILCPNDAETLKTCPWKRKVYCGSGLQRNHERAMDSVSAYALFHIPQWPLADRLKEPYRSVFAVWTEKSRTNKSAKSTLDDDTCSLGSFNTGFSCETSKVVVNASRHFSMRAQQRNVSLREQQLCLKYGHKSLSPQDGTKTIFQLGNIKVVQSGAQQGCVAITAIRTPLLRSIQESSEIDGEPNRIESGEYLSGLVSKVVEDRLFGFIETHKGSIFFHRSNTESQQLPPVGSVVSCKAWRQRETERLYALNVVVLASNEYLDDGITSEQDDPERPKEARSTGLSHSTLLSTNLTTMPVSQSSLIADWISSQAEVEGGECRSLSAMHSGVEGILPSSKTKIGKNLCKNLEPKDLSPVQAL